VTWRDPIVVAVAVGLLLVIAVAVSRTGRRVAATGWVVVKRLTAAVVALLGGRPTPAPVVVRRSFEDLGPTYIKLGQLIASSQGLFPEAYCTEFRKCLDRCLLYTSRCV